MSDKDLRLQVVLNAVDKLTRPFRSAKASTRELADSLRTAHCARQPEGLRRAGRAHRRLPQSPLAACHHRQQPEGRA